LLTISIGRTQPGAAAQQYCRRNRRKIEQARALLARPKGSGFPGAAAIQSGSRCRWDSAYFRAALDHAIAQP